MADRFHLHRLNAERFPKRPHSRRRILPGPTAALQAFVCCASLLMTAPLAAQTGADEERRSTSPSQDPIASEQARGTGSAGRDEPGAGGGGGFAGGDAAGDGTSALPPRDGLQGRRDGPLPSPGEAPRSGALSDGGNPAAVGEGGMRRDRADTDATRDRSRGSVNVAPERSPGRDAADGSEAGSGFERGSVNATPERSPGAETGGDAGSGSERTSVNTVPQRSPGTGTSRPESGTADRGDTGTPQALGSPGAARQRAADGGSSGTGALDAGGGSRSSTGGAGSVGGSGGSAGGAGGR